MADVKDVAAAIMSYVGECTTMKLQKLLYYCQGHHLAWDGVLLFDAKIEAWANGPVVRDVYNLHRGKYWLTPPWPEGGDPTKLNRDEIETVEAVLDNFGRWTARELSDTTHRERPWIEARDGAAPEARGYTEIDTDVMQDFFTGLLEAQNS